MTNIPNLSAPKDEVLAKMAKLPPGASHVGVANIQGFGLSVIVAGDQLPPTVFNPVTKQWVRMVQSLTPGKSKLLT